MATSHVVGWIILMTLLVMTSQCDGEVTVYVGESAAVEGLCEAQCQSWCYEVGSTCESTCGGPGSRRLMQENADWLVTCSERSRRTRDPTFADCIGTCSTLANMTGYVPVRPTVTITRDSMTKTIVLSWNLDPLASLNTIYVVSQLQPHIGPDTWLQLGWVRGDYYQITSIQDICSMPVYRVAAVSPYGSRWFSNSVTTPALVPGPPRHLNLTVLDYRATPRDRDSIYYTLEWQPPDGWSAKDVTLPHLFRYAPHCYQRYMMDTVYVFSDYIGYVEERNVFTRSGRIPTYAIGCNITFMISAISRCDDKLIGAEQDYIVSLTCDKIPAYDGQYCRTPPVIAPGPVKNVTLAIIPKPSGILGLVSWLPPDRLGSAGRVELYHIFWGVMDLSSMDLIEDFTSLLGHVTVPGTELGVDIYINVTSLGPYETIGVVVRAAGPGQIVDTPYGDITKAFNRVGGFQSAGTILTDDGTVVVVQTGEEYESEATSTSVQVYWRRPKLDKGVEKTAGYGLQWGIMGGDSLDNSTDSSQHDGLFEFVPEFHPINMTTTSQTT